MKEKRPSEAKMTDKPKTVTRNLRTWVELADMKVGQLILEGGDRTWPELLRRIRRLDKTGQDVIQGTRK